METLTGNQIRAITKLKKAQDYLDKAIEQIEIAKGLAPSIRGEAEYYTIPWLKNFQNNSNQPGNIAGMIRNIAGSEDI